MRIRKPVFDTPIQDEIELAHQSEQLLKNLSSPPTKAEILQLTKTHSSDIATRCFFDGVRQSKKYGRTIQKIDSQSITPDKVTKKLRLYIVPGMFYKEHPELGTSGDLVKKIAQKFDIDVKIINTNSTGTIAENTKIVSQQLLKESHPNIWLLSISKGSCDVKSILQAQSKTREDTGNISGWIDIAGIHQGVPFIDKAFESVLSRTYLRIISALFNIKYTVFKELRCSEQHWQNKNWPSHIDVIHIVPVPLQSHVHNSILCRYKQTLTHGPNDGFVPLSDVLEMPGSIYPVWGYDHYLRTPYLSELLHKLFNYIQAH